ncbi:hypothetical protein FKM82_012179 [Ascaphus truei]
MEILSRIIQCSMFIIREWKCIEILGIIIQCSAACTLSGGWKCVRETRSHCYGKVFRRKTQGVSLLSFNDKTVI